ncbi:thioredoxin [Siphonobacter aquaeclarae]|uniref:Thioredoxin n=1 Tax=Siphonobacter aquaeclarae TaxID=563176 RepID=A0A1G9PVN8_9BACT|nr:thioredoxin [Siphonobacter aquaeclarae]SDM02809.1 thioredoxin [Siphonobacter aquaeclarae]
MNGNFQQLIQSEKPVLIDFFAEWCGPCKMMAPHLKALKDKMGENLTVVKIDIDKNPALATQLQVRSVPTLALYQQGRLLWRQSGALTAPQLESIVHQHTLPS